ncbi:MAG: coproporphyrinogen-III oxidase family protein, partial [Alphaproteobacteria bacterium]
MIKTPIAQNQTPQQVRGLAIYIHWPFCRSKCPYCDFNSHVRDSVDQEAWRQALLSELEWMAAHCRDREVSSIFFGGGTPSLMPPKTAAALIERVLTLWPVAEGIEITLEANPTSVEADTFGDFHKAGVNRVSLGVQSLDDAQLKLLGREHSAKEALKAVDRARQIFDRYTFDLIYARPNQTVNEWQHELEEALTHAGSHLSLYQLTIEENTAFAHAYKKGEFAMPDEETSEALY